MKQLGTGWKMYITDYDGWIPRYYCGGQYIQVFLQPYIKNAQVMVCPSDERGRTRSYGYNYCHLGTGYATGIGAAHTEDQLTNANGFVFGETIGNNVAMYPPWYASSRVGRNTFDRHLGGANYVFNDGHVKWLPPSPISDTGPPDGDEWSPSLSGWSQYWRQNTLQSPWT